MKRIMNIVANQRIEKLTTENFFKPLRLSAVKKLVNYFNTVIKTMVIIIKKVFLQNEIKNK